MQRIDVSNRVRIVKPPPGKPELLNKTGVVVIVTDGTNALVQLDDGRSEMLAFDQLQKI